MSKTLANFNCGADNFENELVVNMKQSVQIHDNRHEIVNQSESTNKNVDASGSSERMEKKKRAEEAKPSGDERICLVGAIASDEQVVATAVSFNVPVITSETGIDVVKDTQWTTYFVMSEFDSEHFNAIRKSKHRIYGPTALKQIAQAGNGLVYVNRPIYSFSFKRVILSFTGIREKDVLKRLIDMIHMMGGSIRKDLKGHRDCTHLISIKSTGDKYLYAKTFNLVVVRPSWVYDAWERRNDTEFFANDKDFVEMHTLKPFEGLRVAFYGFQPDEHQEMVDILKVNGGTTVDRNDPECTHMIISNKCNRVPDLGAGPLSPTPSTVSNPPKTPSIKPFASTPNASDAEFNLPTENDMILIEATTQAVLNQQTIIETPRKPTKLNFARNDDIALNGNKENLHDITEENENDAKSPEIPHCQRDNFDNISIISTDTNAAPFGSAKKPKLIRTGSVKRSLRRSMSFAAFKNPISSMINVRRSSHDASIVSIESTHTEASKRRTTKNKLQSLKDRITNRSKREGDSKTPKRNNSVDLEDDRLAQSSVLSDNKMINSTMNEAAMADFDVPAGFGNQVVTPEEFMSLKYPELPQANTDFVDNSSLVGVPPVLPAVLDANAGDGQLNSALHLLKSDWFWYTIQKGVANEKDYRFGENFERNTPGGDWRNLYAGVRKPRKKRFSLLGNSMKRRSSHSEAGLSLSGSFLECTNSPNAKHDSKDLDGSITNTPKSKKQKSMRFNRFMELYSTESNYVGILHAIVSEFQKPLDDMVDTPEELLNKSELRSIFNNFSPIYEVHLEMLNHFKELQSTWSDGCLIGKIILDHRDALLKAYPPYVNYFEQMKDTLRQCIAQNPKFHAFLKINESKSECGRQSLEDLMIRPVQRLPSISLLISDILKHTPKSNPDYKVLDESLNAIRDVMKYINEDKRKTEGRVALFDIFNDIDNCPADLVSSHRSYISRCEVSELSNCLSGRDDSLMIFLFTDYIEICKIRKSRGLNHIRSPPGTINTLNTTTRAHSHTHSKAYKHIRLIPLSSIPMVYDINDSERAFAMKIKDKFYCFNIQEECEKKVYLINFCKQLAENACRADYGQFLHECDSHELGIDISDINSGTLKRVYNFARTRLVSRAFSFKTTPLRVKRTVSTTSPLYLSTNSLM